MEEKEIKRILKEFLEKPDNFLDIEYWEGTEIKIDTELKEVIKEIIKTFSLENFIKNQNANSVLKEITIKDYILEKLQGKDNKYYFFDENEFYLIDEVYVETGSAQLRNCNNDCIIELKGNDKIYKLVEEV